MSIMQEYEEIRKEIGEEKYLHIEEFLKQHSEYELSDVYYRECVWNEFQEWEASMGRVRFCVTYEDGFYDAGYTRKYSYRWFDTVEDAGKFVTDCKSKGRHAYVVDNENLPF